MRVATTERSLAIASRSACPNGSIVLGWQRTSHAATQPATSAWGIRPSDPDPIPAGETRAQRPVADERELATLEPGEGIGEPDRALALLERSDEEVERPLALPAELGAGGRCVSPAKALQVDSAVDHVGSPVQLREPEEQLSAKVLRHANHRAGPPDRQLRREPDPANRADVPNVPPVRGQNEGRTRGPRRDRRDRPCRHEKMGVHDVRAEAPSRTHGVDAEARVLRPRPATPVDHGALELVPLRLQLVLDLGDEGAEVRIVRARVHLRDEQDAHAGRW